MENPCYTTPRDHALPHSSQSRFDAQFPTVPLARPGGSIEPRFPDQVVNAWRVKHLAYHTELSCVEVKRFILFHGKRHPQDMGPTEVRVNSASLTGPDAPNDFRFY